MILRWVVAEALVGSVVVACLAPAGWFVGGRAAPALAVGTALALIWLVAALLGAERAVRVSRPSQVQSGEAALGLRPDRFLAAAGPVGFALRSLVALPARTTMDVCGLRVAAAAVAMACVEVTGAATSGGPTLLAGAVASELAPRQIALLLASSAAALVFAVAALLSRHVEARHERQALRSVGWADRQIRRMAGIGRLISAAPAAAVAPVLVALLAETLGLALAPTPLAVLLLCLSIPLLVGPATRLRIDR